MDGQAASRTTRGVFYVLYRLGPGEREEDLGGVFEQFFGEEVAYGFGVGFNHGGVVCHCVVTAWRRIRVMKLFSSNAWERAGALGDMLEARWPEDGCGYDDFVRGAWKRYVQGSFRTRGDVRMLLGVRAKWRAEENKRQRVGRRRPRNRRPGRAIRDGANRELCWDAEEVAEALGDAGCGVLSKAETLPGGEEVELGPGTVLDIGIVLRLAEEGRQGEETNVVVDGVGDGH